MSVLTKPRTEPIATAIELARGWCAGHVIDGSPALGHAIKVARKIEEHQPDAPAALLAAVIVHDAPYFAPKDLDLDTVLTGRLGPDVTQIVRTIEREHHALDTAATPEVDTSDPDALIASAADKTVSIAAIVRRSRRSIDPDDYWDRRRPFVDRLPYFWTFVVKAAPHLPASLARELHLVVAQAASEVNWRRRLGRRRHDGQGTGGAAGATLIEHSNVTRDRRTPP